MAKAVDLLRCAAVSRVLQELDIGKLPVLDGRLHLPPVKRPSTVGPVYTPSTACYGLGVAVAGTGVEVGGTGVKVGVTGVDDGTDACCGIVCSNTASAPCDAGTGAITVGTI
ncbi:MAG: hypothetical protein U0703_11665 [Anaerolineae bacterium]